jgi:hypothetical protein
VVVKLAYRQKKDEVTGQWVDTNRVDLHYSDIWHVDDAEVAKTGVVLDADSLKMIPAALRKAVPVNGATVANGNGSVAGAVKTAPVNAVGSTRGGVDLSNV